MSPTPPPVRRLARALERSLDENPRDRIRTVNIREADKVTLSKLQAWWSLRGDEPISQWDAFTRVLRSAMHDPDVVRALEVSSSQGPDGRA